MSASSNYLETRLLDHALGTTTFTKPTTVYVALFNNTSGNALTNLETGNVFTDEVPVGAGGTATAYARQSVTFAAASSPGGSASSNATVTFPTATPTGYGTVSHVAIVDNATAGAGNVLFFGALTASKVVDAGDTFTIQSGSLTVTLA